MSVSFLMDVHVQSAITTGLRRRGVDVLTAQEDGPDSAGSRLSSFNDVVGTTFFPRYLEPFAPEHIVAVPPGPRRMLTDPDVGPVQLSKVDVGKEIALFLLDTLDTAEDPQAVIDARPILKLGADIVTVTGR